ADTLRAELARAHRVLGRVRVGAHLEAAELVGPFEDRGELPGDFGLLERNLTEINLPGRPVDRDDVTFIHGDVTRRETARAQVDVQRVGPTHARLTHAAGDDSRVRCLATAAREDALCGDHAVEIVGVRLAPNEDDLLAL